MGISRCNISFLQLFLFLLLNVTHFLSFVQTLCHVDEGSALLQFKESFSIHKSASENPFAYPKVASWTRKGGERSNCCSWDGVECNEETGHVIGLDLRSSCLYGSVNYNSSLFQVLVHLQKLDLSDNHFNFSEILSTLGHLTSLAYLNLSKSSFSGLIPTEISKLSKLSAIDLSFNYENSTDQLLRLEEANQLRSLVLNLTHLKQLHLSRVNIPFTVPDVLVNASSLTSLRLENCGLIGEFPVGIFHLPNLQVLDLDTNQDLTGHFPDFNRSSPLEYLNVARTSFSGYLPASLGNLRSLKFLNIEYCEFNSHLPSSLGNLTELNYLDLSFFFDRSFTHSDISPNNFSLVDSWSCIGKLTKLQHLGLGHTYLKGEFPTFVANLTQLEELNLGNNNITGEIPSWLTKFTKLTLLNLRFNNLQGAIPRSLFYLHNLELLDLSSNNLIGSVDFDTFFNLKKLRVLKLSFNKLSLQMKSSLSATAPMFEVLKLGSCNLTEFPEFLKNSSRLVDLDLSDNYIQGQIPKWMWSSTRETLLSLNLSGNSLSGFDQNLVGLPWRNLKVFQLGFNRIQGSLPAPPATIKIYSVPNNVYSGEMSASFCNLSSLLILDLSNNNLSGLIPQCLGNSGALEILNLRNNSFQGQIPPMCTNGISFKSVDLSENMLQGELPISMANCTRLEFLNLGKNQISGILPTWLWDLPVLRVLRLRSNRFYGTIVAAPTNLGSSIELCIIDLSHNSFSGTLPILPHNYEVYWNCLESVGGIYEESTMFQDTYRVGAVTYHYDYSMSISGIGVVLKPLKYADSPYFKVIDLSSNKFEGEIPTIVYEYLVGLQLLNLSNNILIGSIPSSIGNWTGLESLDLSNNHLSGEIPRSLEQLTSISAFNVSHNHLRGPVPHENQFRTFERSSYLGNPSLCGFPLQVKCEDSETSKSQPPGFIEEDHQDPDYPFEWRVFFPAGLASGLVVGFVAGNTLTTNKQQWFVEKFCKRRRHPRRTNKGRRAHRNF
ncbi:receptor-like protein 7 [Rosa rugosa]|uniref:receptor-like protein 7 n=1 Tax=Rosa rugosa TaxID=74645 RepID=UPI002B4095C2|nr:receptor-like protein 7 [Rosa rugosa]